METGWILKMRIIGRMPDAEVRLSLNRRWCNGGSTFHFMSGDVSIMSHLLPVVPLKWLRPILGLTVRSVQQVRHLNRRVMSATINGV